MSTKAQLLTGGRDVSAYLLLLLVMILAGTEGILQLEAASSPDFSISASPTSVVVNPGLQGNSTISVASQQGFVGRVNMTVSVSPHGLYCQLTNMSVDVVANRSNSTMLHCDGFPGIFTVTVTGNATVAGTVVSHQLAVNYVVTDFSISANPSWISLQIGQVASTRVTISSQQAFTERIYLNLTLPTGVNGSITPSILSGPGTAKLKVNSTTAGTYTLTIVAASGSISHQLSLTVSVTNPSASPGGMIFGLQPVIFYTILAVVVVWASAVVMVSIRKSKRILRGGISPEP